jgi:hypothetical protein
MAKKETKKETKKAEAKVLCPDEDGYKCLGCRGGNPCLTA